MTFIPSRPSCLGFRRALVVVRLVALDQLLHLGRVALEVTVTDDRMVAACRLDQDVGKDHVRIDLDRGDVRHVDRLLAFADPLGVEERDARRRDRAPHRSRAHRKRGRTHRPPPAQGHPLRISRVPG